MGGSWGATLALKYAIKYTKNVSAILLRSVFLGTMREIQWAFDDGPKTFAPKLHQDFMGKVDKGEKFIDFYYQKIVKKDSKLHSWLWHDYERILSQINLKIQILRILKLLQKDKVCRTLHSWNFIT